MPSPTKLDASAARTGRSLHGDSFGTTQKNGVRADWSGEFKPTPKWKRTVDILGSLSLLILLSPLLTFVALTIKLGSPGPIIFKQRRHGAAGELFYIWKFRTMRHNANNNHRRHVVQLAGSRQPLRKIRAKGDYIPLARIWRAVGIDELPQLVNVLRSEMSLVGPRPDVLKLDDYEPWQLRRFEVVPGLTGLWQVNGKNRTTFDEMIRFDIDYVQQRSFWLDVRILMKTIPAVLRLALD